MKDFSESFFWLDESRVVNFCYNTTEPSVSLALNMDNSKVKLYLADTGLLVTMAFGAYVLEKDGVYEKILKGKLDYNRVILMEKLVAQQLCVAGHPLYFYTSSSRESAERMEIDFLIRKNEMTNRHNITPIEVKSSNRYSLSSLQKFTMKFKNYLATPTVLHPGDLEEKNGILYLPIYMCGLL